jgi:hypothetical protein
VEALAQQAMPCTGTGFVSQSSSTTTTFGFDSSFSVEELCHSSITNNQYGEMTVVDREEFVVYLQLFEYKIHVRSG